MAETTAGQPGPFTYRRHHRLLVPAAFKQVLDNAELRAVQPAFLFLAIRNSATHPRIGFVLPKRRIRHAVERNRVKRIIREAFRHLPPDYPPLDIVVMARDGLPALTAATLRAAAEQQFAVLVRRYARLQADVPTPDS